MHRLRRSADLTPDKAYMYESYYWLGVPGDTKSMLSMDYGLADAKPIWTQNPRFGNILYIFESLAQRRKDVVLCVERDRVFGVLH